MNRFLILFFFLATSCFGSVTITISNPAVLHGLSPYNWNINGSTSLISINPDSYLKLGFTGTSIAINVNPATTNSSYSSQPTWYPIFQWQIDGVIYPSHQETSSDSSVSLATGLAAGNHTLFLYLIGMGSPGNVNRWFPLIDFEVGLSGNLFTIDTAATVFNAPLKNGGWYLALGDSITEAQAIYGSILFAQNQQGYFSYATLLANALNLEFGEVGFAGQAYNGAEDGVPGVLTSYNLISQGINRTFSPLPSLVTVNEGTNGTVASADVTTLLTSLRATLGPLPQIVQIIPFGQYNVAAITTGFTNYTSTNPSDHNVVLINLGSTGSNYVVSPAYSEDGIHPNQLGHYQETLLLLPLMPVSTRGGVNPASSSFAAP